MFVNRDRGESQERLRSQAKVLKSLGFHLSPERISMVKIMPWSCLEPELGSFVPPLHLAPHTHTFSKAAPGVQVKSCKDELEMPAIESKSSPEPEGVHRNGEREIWAGINAVCHRSLGYIQIQKANSIK